jgi:Zinc-binding dehydrogenase
VRLSGPDCYECGLTHCAGHLDAMTASLALDHLPLRPRDTLLVTGAAGSVGGFAVELARTRGVRIVAQGRPEDEEFLRGRGATWFVSRDEELTEAVRRFVPEGVDGVLDAAALGAHALAAVRDGGIFVSVRSDVLPAPERGVVVRHISAGPEATRLSYLSALAEVGMLTPRVAQIYPLSQAAEAHALLARGGQHRHGWRIAPADTRSMSYGWAVSGAGRAASLWVPIKGCGHGVSPSWRGRVRRSRRRGRGPTVRRGGVVPCAGGQLPPQPGAAHILAELEFAAQCAGAAGGGQPFGDELLPQGVGGGVEDQHLAQGVQISGSRVDDVLVRAGGWHAGRWSGRWRAARR